MATFKEDMYSDVYDVFLDDTEFADLHNVDGKEMLAVVDELDAIRRQARSSNDVEGVFKKHILLFAPRNEFEKAPTAGTRIFKLDGKRYQVDEVNEEGEMYAIVLEVYSGK